MYQSCVYYRVLTKAASPKGLRRGSFYAFTKLPNLLFRQYGSVSKRTINRSLRTTWRLRNNGFLLLPSSDEPLSLFIHDFANARAVMRHFKKRIGSLKLKRMKRNLATVFFIVLCIFTGKLQAQNPYNYTMSSGGKLEPLQAIMDIRHYTIALNVDIDKKAIKGYTEIELILSSATDTLLFDLTHIMKVNKIVVDTKEQLFVSKDDKIYIINKSAFTAAKHSVRIYYEGIPPVPVRPPWASGFTWTNDRDGNPFVNITCQGDGGKTYFPCKDHPSDEPNEGADLFITIPNSLSVAGPGLLQSVKAEKKIGRAHV